MSELTTVATTNSGDASDLLYVLSARQEISWRAFKAVFDALATANAPAQEQVEMGADEAWEGRFARQQTATVLDALAHCDFDWQEGQGRVYVAPPVLARLPRAGLPQAVLCGARSPQTRAQLEKICAANSVAVEWTAQTSDAALGLAFVPPRVAFQAAKMENLEAVARELNIVCYEQPPAWQLLYVTSSLSDTLAACRWAPASELNWRRRDFATRQLQFRESKARYGDAQLIRYTHPRRQTRQHYIVRDGESALIDLDWGRYAALSAVGSNVLAYDERSFDFAVPAGAPLPRLLARSLALCSGFAPRFLSRQNAPWNSPEPRGFNIYRWIPPRIAEIVATKLGQALLKKEIR